MNTLGSPSLAEWADQLLTQGIATDAIVTAAVNNDLPAEKTITTFEQICSDLKLDTSVGYDRLKELAIIEEYRCGHFSAPHVVFACNHFRIETNFPEQLTAAFVYDDGIESVAYHGLDTGLTGDDLESQCLDHLERHGITRNQPNPE